MNTKIKKIISVFFLVTTMFLFCSCENTKEENVEKTEEDIVTEAEEITWLEPNYLDFNDMLKIASENHMEAQQNNTNLDNAAKEIETHEEDKDVLSQAELDQLMMVNEQKSSISSEDAISDVELLFRLFKYAYGAYYFFGGDETFYPARDRIINTIKNEHSQSIAYDELEKIIHDELIDFVRDRHFVIGDLILLEVNRGMLTKYYYDYSHQFSKDDKGFFKTNEQNEKFYFSGFEKSDATIEPTLLDDGNITYSPVQLAKADEHVESDFILLKNPDGKEIKEEVKWKTIGKSAFNHSEVKYISSENLSYFIIRSTNEYSDEIRNVFVGNAENASSSKAIIMDIRSNNGGMDSPYRDWIKKYSGVEPVLNGLHIGRYSLVNNPVYSGFISHREKGNIIENSIPMIVLVDDMCGSSGESCLNFMKCFNNSIVVGSNSAGAQICGNQTSFFLPKSGIKIQFGVILNFIFDYHNVDYVGYKPDLWCTPARSLENISKALNRSGYTNDKEYNEIMSTYFEDVEENVLSDLGKMNLLGKNTLFKEGKNTCSGVDDFFDIMRNGSFIGTYDLEIGFVSEGLFAEKKEGKIHLVCAEKGEYILEMIYKDEPHVFIIEVE